jgi:Uri superfamily endonuclease
MNHGTYQVRLTISRPITVAVGKLGVFRFLPGEYLYFGRARRGLEARLDRHRRKTKPLRWHIDYLTVHPAVDVWDTVVTGPDPEAECASLRAVLDRGGVEIPVPGFGASDCRSGCPAHLLRIVS